MKIDSIKTTILTYLSQQTTHRPADVSHLWVFGGTLDSDIAAMCECKQSNVSRRARELVNDGKIERRLIQIDGKGPKVVQYRYLPPIEMPPAYKPVIDTKQLNLI